MSELFEVVGEAVASLDADGQVTLRRLADASLIAYLHRNADSIRYQEFVMLQGQRYPHEILIPSTLAFAYVVEGCKFLGIPLHLSDDVLRPVVR